MSSDMFLVRTSALNALLHIERAHKVVLFVADDLTCELDLPVSLCSFTRTHLTKMSTVTATTGPTPKPWHAAYPAPRNSQPAGLGREKVLAMLKAESSSPRDFLLVDLRRTDHEVRPSFSLW